MGRRRTLIWATLVATGAIAAGCGGDDDYANNPRPPSPINVSAAITEDGISVSPRSFGAGPVVLIIANQTDSAHRVTLETDVLASSEPGIKQSTAPINPRGTATLKVNLRQGTYEVSVPGSDLDAARVKVGAQRESAQDQLLQP